MEVGHDRELARAGRLECRLHSNISPPQHLDDQTVSDTSSDRARHTRIYHK